MKSKSRKPVNSNLVTGTLVEITDPVEQAEIDRRFRAAEKAIVGRENSKRPRSRKAK